MRCPNGRVQCFNRDGADDVRRLSGVGVLDEIRHCEAWMFEDEGPTLVVTLVEALGNLVVPS
jgi:hypothetical protein